MTDQHKSILIVCRRPPYGNSLAREAIDIALAATAFDQDIAVLFIGDGVYQLLADQQSESIDSKNHGKVLSAFPLYDINKLYIEQQAITERNLDINNLVLSVEALSTNEIKHLMGRYQTIFNF